MKICEGLTYTVSNSSVHVLLIFTDAYTYIYQRKESYSSFLKQIPVNWLSFALNMQPKPAHGEGFGYVVCILFKLESLVVYEYNTTKFHLQHLKS